MFVQEFTNINDKKEQIYGSPLEQERFFNMFKDHQLEEGENTFAFFKRSIEKQLAIREVIKGVIHETNE